MKFRPWLENQQPEIRFYNRDRERYGFLSNFHPAPFTINGVTYGTVEHFYVAAKSQAQSYKNAILAAPTPGKAKRLGSADHKQSLFKQGAVLRPDWEQTKFGVMMTGVSAKFKQNSHLMDALKATQPAVLLEDSPTDLVWGTGPIDEMGRFPGQNILGKILMQIRAEG